MMSIVKGKLQGIIKFIRQTIHEPTPFPNSIWKNLSQEAKSFVDSKND